MPIMMCHRSGVYLHGSVRYYGDTYYDDLNTVLIPHHTLANIGFQYQTEMYGHAVTFYRQHQQRLQQALLGPE